MISSAADLAVAGIDVLNILLFYKLIRLLSIEIPRSDALFANRTQLPQHDPGFDQVAVLWAFRALDRTTERAIVGTSSDENSE
jgi:hypothetical protein